MLTEPKEIPLKNAYRKKLLHQENIETTMFNKVLIHKQSQPHRKNNNYACTCIDGNQEICGLANSVQERDKRQQVNQPSAHSERISIAIAILNAIIKLHGVFADDKFNTLRSMESDRAQQTILNLLSLDSLQNPSRLINREDQQIQQYLLEAIGQSTIDVYSEREFCIIQRGQDPGCKYYLDVLEDKSKVAINSTSPIVKGYFTFPSPETGTTNRSEIEFNRSKTNELLAAFGKGDIKIVLDHLEKSSISLDEKVSLWNTFYDDIDCIVEKIAQNIFSNPDQELVSTIRSEGHKSIEKQCQLFKGILEKAEQHAKISELANPELWRPDALTSTTLDSSALELSSQDIALKPYVGSHANPSSTSPPTQTVQQAEMSQANTKQIFDDINEKINELSITSRNSRKDKTKKVKLLQTILTLVEKIDPIQQPFEVLNEILKELSDVKKIELVNSTDGNLSINNKNPMLSTEEQWGIIANGIEKLIKLQDNVQTVISLIDHDHFKHPGCHT